MNKKMDFVSPCLFGLESILSFELKQIGAEDIKVTDGRVSYSGDEAVLARANLWLRTAARVSIALKTFKALTFTELFDGVGEIPFEDFIGRDDSFPVKGWCVDSQLASVPSCQSIIKKSIVKRLTAVHGIEIFPETGPIHQVSFSIFKDEVTIMLDTSGDALHKRGYRRLANIAPLRETLAAGIVDLARIREHNTVYDPMCGSGTLLIEAAQKAANIPPGLNREFEVESWGVSSKEVWEKERQAGRDSIRKNIKFRAYGFDNDRNIIKVARDNAKKAGVSDLIEFEYADIKDFAPKSPSITLCNPPYGERMLDNTEAVMLFKEMGKVMSKEKGNSYYIINPQEDFEEIFGRKADRRRKLYNGNMPCQLYMYYK